MGRSNLLPLALFALLPACEVAEKIQPVPPAELGLWEDVSASVEDQELASLCARFWDYAMEADPLRATALGDPRHHGAWPPNSEQALKKDLELLDEMLADLARIDPDLLAASDRLTYGLLEARVRDDRGQIALGLHNWTVDPLVGPHLEILNVTRHQPVRTARERAQLVERWSRFPGYLRVAAFNLKRAANEGRIASNTAFEKQLDQLDAFLDTEPMDSPLVTIATGGGRWVELPPNGSVAKVAHEELGDARHQRELRKLNLHLQDGERLALGTRVLLPGDGDQLGVEERGKFLYEVFTTVEQDIYPAVAGYRDTLRELSARARPDEKPGLVHVPGGAAAYRTMIAYHTSLPPAECDPKAIHEFGLAEVDRIRAEMADLGEKVFGTRDVDEIQRRLRTDPAMHFETRDEVRDKAESALRKAEGKMRQFFGIVPRARCEVWVIPPHEEKDSTIAYYNGPEPGGGRPGVYYINTSAPATRPRYEAEVLAYHEAIPGHHLQIAIAQELEDLPLFRRHFGSTAFVEGWALYTERLSDEMGLYTGDVDRLGVLSYDAWRACRLVVDTGLHAFGWSRDQAIQYMRDNTLLAYNNIDNEVDRYIAWPGQALAYKLGQREILALRDEARDALGSRFRYPDFHDVVLSDGAVTLPVLRGLVRDWIRAEGGLAVEANAGGESGR